MLSAPTKPSLYRDFLLLSVLIVCVLLLVAVWIMYQTQQSHSEDVFQQLENEALRIDRALIVEIEQTSYLLESIGRQIDTESVSLEEDIKRLLGTFAQNKAMQESEFYWVDERQQAVLSGQAGRLTKPIDVADRDYMKRAITAPWQVHIGQPIEGRASGQWMMPLALGVTNERGDFLGAVLIGLNIKVLGKVINDVLKDPKINYAITNIAFTLLTQMADSSDFFVSNFPLDKLTNIALSNGQNGIFSKADWFQSDVIHAYYEKSSQYPYLIFVGYDPKSSRETMIATLLPKLLQIVVMTLFLILTLWTVRKRIIQPVMQLTRDTKSILQGKPVRHDASNDPEEIDELAQAIAKLADYIQERRHIEREMAAKNSELMKVKEAAEMTNLLKATFFERVGEALMQPAKSIDEYVSSMRDELFGPLGNEKYLEMTEALHRQNTALMHTLTDIRAISKAETGLLALNESPVDLNLAINKAVRLLKERANAHAPDVVIDLDDDLPKIMADELRLKQLILNMLLHAGAEAGDGQTVRLTSLLAPDEIRIELLYRPKAYVEVDVLHPPESSQIAMSAVGFYKLGRALCELIAAMHGGAISSKPLPDGTVKQMISLPAKRMC